MQKKVIIVILSVLVCACTVSRKGVNGLEGESSKDANRAIKEAIDNNITSDGFFISKGRISTSGDAGRISLYFTMKYEVPGIYLISLRSKTGMEAFRIFISNDTVLINDRLNKTVLTGTTNDFERITGIPSALLKISIGDFFYSSPKFEEAYCTNNEIKISDYYKGIIIKTILDCSRGKAKTLQLTTGITDEYINIEYTKYRSDRHKLPKIVEVYDFRRKTRIKVTVYKYSAPWYGEISFIPGSGYIIKPLL